MKVIDCLQGTPEWFAARMGVATASEFDALVTPLWKVKEGKALKTYLAFKLAEKWLGRPIQTFAGGMMDQGKIREEEAIPYYELEFNTEIHPVGFVTDDAGRIGASPDGMFENGTGIEIKCPEPQKHVAYLLNRGCPEEYRHQVQGSMLVTGAAVWRFLSYCRGFPPLVVTVERDEAAMKSLRDALADFVEKFDEGWKTLLKINGGPPAPPPTVEVGEDGSIISTMAGKESEVTEWLRNGEKR